MVQLTRKREILEEIITLENVDPVVCREKLKGDIDEQGKCLVRVVRDPSEPMRAELKKFSYIGRTTPLPQPQEEKKE